MEISSLRNRYGRRTGLTLVEMLVTLTVAGVVLLAGIPEFKRMLASNRMLSEINALVAHLHLARSEAVNRGKRAVLCPSADREQCTGSPEWHQGYILFVDDNGDRKRDENEALVRVHQRRTPGILITSSVSRRRITYRPDGTAPGSNLTVKFCAQHHATPPKAVILSNTGRPRVSRSTASGDPLDCG